MTDIAPAFAPGPTIADLLERYRTGRSTPVDVVRTVLAAIAQRGDDGVWIEVAAEADLMARALELQGLPTSLPLYGVPFGVKDSIDVDGVPTTLSCPDYALCGREHRAGGPGLLDAGGILRRQDAISTSSPPGSTAPERHTRCRAACSVAS